MKQISLLLFLCIASLTTMAQESIPQDTIIYFNGRKLVVQERGNKIKVKMYESQKENDTIENAQVFEGVYLDGVSVERTTVVSLPFTTKKSKSYSGYRFRPHYPTLYFGFDKLGGGAFQYSADVPQIGSKSWEWGMNLCSGGIAFTSNNHWGITSAFGFARIDYKLDNNYGFEKVDGVTVCKQASDDIELLLSGKNQT